MELSDDEPDLKKKNKACGSFCSWDPSKGSCKKAWQQRDELKQSTCLGICEQKGGTDLWAGRKTKDLGEIAGGKGATGWEFRGPTNAGSGDQIYDSCSVLFTEMLAWAVKFQTHEMQLEYHPAVCISRCKM